MNLRPRHYVLIVVILALGAFNLVRHYRLQHASQHRVIAVQHGISPIWAFYDQAAALRDAPDAQFKTAIDSLTQHIDSANGVAIPPQTSRSELSDLRGCRTWLLFYRQSRTGGGAQANWLQRSRRHVAFCVANHADVAL